MPRPVLAFASLALAASASADPRWHVEGALWTTSPAALEQAIVVGGVVDARRRLGEGPVFASARLGLGSASAANASWLLDDTQVAASLGVGLEAQVDVARLWAQASLGGQLVAESLHRQQWQRLAADGVPNVSRSSWTIGPLGALEVGVALGFYGGWTAVFAGGPTLAAARVNGATALRWGGSTLLGVGHVF